MRVATGALDDGRGYWCQLALAALGWVLTAAVVVWLGLQAGEIALRITLFLLHDRLAGTVEATPCILEGLRKAGLEPGRIIPARRPSAQNADSRIKVVR